MALRFTLPFVTRSFTDAQANFDKLIALIIAQVAPAAPAGLGYVAGGASRIGHGGGSVTITDGTSNFVTFAHGLGFNPTRIVASARTTPDTRNDWIANVASWDGTNITVSVRAGAAESFPAANPTTVTFDFIAIT